VHSVVTALGAWRFFDAIESGDLNLPDGAPIAWIMRSAGATGQARISGPDLMWRYLAEAEREGHVVSVYGDTEDTLRRLRAEMLRAFPGLRIGVLLSPPFGPISAAQDAADVCRINDAGTQALFVALGCPKQELWMDAHRGRIQATMLGVGAAVATHAGVIRRAPVWMQRCGLEWLHRLSSEPRRLAHRYLLTNSVFLLRILRSGRSAR
jgi:N-acetylglucosaminyldiphosphoundecaprenol N-acetyl-beta-D-mannosaminyltransferase